MSLLPVVAEVENVSEAEAGDVYQQGSLASLILRTFTKNKLAIVGVVIVVAMVLFSFVGPFFYHTDQVDTNIIESNIPAPPLATCSGRTTTGTTSSADLWPAARSRSRSGWR